MKVQDAVSKPVDILHDCLTIGILMQFLIVNLPSFV